MSLALTSTIAEAREWLRARAGKGEKCPCCGRLVKIYVRPLNSVMARFVAALYREHGRGWGAAASVARKHLPDVAHQGGQLVLGQHWGLIEPEPRVRGDQGRSGVWRVTEKGEDWLAGHISVQKYAHISHGDCLALDGPMVTRESTLGEHFDFADLMGSRSPYEPSLFDQRNAA